MNEKVESLKSNWEKEVKQFLKYNEDTTLNKRKIIFGSVVNSKLKAKSRRNGTEPDTKPAPPAQLPAARRELGSRTVLFLGCLCLAAYLTLKYVCCKGASFKLCWNNNIQDWIYPVLRAVRLTSLHVIHFFPSYTDVHEDTCLLENPLYWDWEVDCTLCQRVGVVTLPHADDFERLFYHKGVPVVVQDAVTSRVSWRDLARVYADHPEDIDAGSARTLRPAGLRMRSTRELMQTDESELAQLLDCVEWRLLRVSAVRHLRELFRRPYFVSKETEVALHRFIYICAQEADRFTLPMTEFANVWVAQHSGTRQIQLTPSDECRDTCRTVSALLRPGDTLFYNWRYWRAASLPVPEQLPAATPSALLARCDTLERLHAALEPSGTQLPTCPRPETPGGGKRRLSPQPEVGITFVGSFY